ncbi:hypothetical protein HPB47_012387 [Ixodes persulcatus]|uniref:Uncharacterized protein n=1 Tax=Ixodes persulcatus TaxID=34615 RepID=A0AC60NTX4_IXOPE|nr:hypothetical protein HPB47_012387 [Ixodes persulcatus]
MGIDGTRTLARGVRVRSRVADSTNGRTATLDMTRCDDYRWDLSSCGAADLPPAPLITVPRSQNPPGNNKNDDDGATTPGSLTARRSFGMQPPLPRESSCEVGVPGPPQREGGARRRHALLDCAVDYAGKGPSYDPDGPAADSAGEATRAGWASRASL